MIDERIEFMRNAKRPFSVSDTFLKKVLEHNQSFLADDLLDNLMFDFERSKRRLERYLGFTLEYQPMKRIFEAR
jgi:hypothetical protein